MRPPDAARPVVVLCLCALVLLAAACGGSDSGPVAPNDPPPTTKPPDNPPPQPADPDSATATVTTTGGSVLLPDGSGVIFPAGAVSSAMAVTVRRADPGRWFDVQDSSRAVLTTTAPVTQFAVPVEVRVPLPAGATPADTGSVFAGVVSDDLGYVEMERSGVTVVDGKPFLTVSTTHFTSRLFEWLMGKQPPSKAMLELPYYNQGSSPFCWAASLHMVTQGVSFASPRLLTEVIGSVGVDEGGIGALEFRMGSAVETVVRERTGLRPERKMWDYVNINRAKDYLWQQVGVHGRPVAIFSSRWQHAVVVVGYDMNTFYIHDPASTTPNAVGYTVKPWSSFVDGMALNDKLITLVVPDTLETTRPPLAVNLLSGALQFVKPSSGAGDPSALWVFGWDYRRPEGYSFRHHTLDDLGAPLPGGVTALQTVGELQISNASRTQSHEVTLFVDVAAVGAPSGVGRLETERTVTVGPNKVVNVKLPDIKVDTFRYNTAAATDYTLTVTARTGNATVDRQSIRFSIASVKPELAAVTPKEAATGSEVVLTGKGFGLLALNNKITFNGTPVTRLVSWKDTEVRVVVPDGATTGPVILTRGTVASEAVDFVVSKASTLSGTYAVTFDGNVLKGIKFEASMAWALTATSPVHTETTSGGTHRFTAAKGEGVTIRLDGTASATPSRYDYGTGYYMLIKETFWTFQVNQALGNAAITEEGSGSSRTFGYTMPSGSSQICFLPTFGYVGDIYRPSGEIGTKDFRATVSSVGSYCITPGS